MSVFPPTVPARVVLAGAVGFVSSFAVVLTLSGERKRSVGTDGSNRETPHSRVPTLNESIAKELADLSPRPTAILALAERLAPLDQAQREAALAHALELPPETRRSLLAILLVQWAESEPADAAGWCLDHLPAGFRGECLGDIARIWARSDPVALGDWWVANHSTEELADSSRDSIINVFRETDPVALARYLGRPELSRTFFTGLFFRRPLARTSPLSHYAAAIRDNVGYAGEVEHLTQESSARHQPGKSGWNGLFEQVAVEWHRENPAACEEWLDGFSQDAQLAAWHRIREADE